ncbi:MAG: ROK family protein [Prolixibacteraceae bacterium]|nr:ROK family protein [Prolixibacteraceae bacterium]
MEIFLKNKKLMQGVELKKAGQQKQIIRSLYFHGPGSNAELSRDLGLSTPKVNSLLQEMIHRGTVRELGHGDSSGGRRPVMYGLAPEAFYMVGITINVNFSVIAIFNAQNKEISGPYTLPVKMERDITLFERINDRLQEIIREEGIDRKRIAGVGIELPGLVNQEKHINKTYFPGEEELHLKLGEIFGMPVFFDNDARLRTFAEQHFGLARGRQHVLMVHVDWGIGMGLIVNGQLYGGKSGFSGEFGHIPMADNGILCNCGKIGCLETIASAPAIARQAREGVAGGNSSLITTLVKGDLQKITTSTVIEAARLGDQFSISLLSQAGFWLGKGMAQLMQVFNPELIIIGGMVAEAGQFMMAPIQQAIYTYANSDISNDTEILFSILGVRAGAIGAAAFALEKLANN